MKKYYRWSSSEKYKGFACVSRKARDFIIDKIMDKVQQINHFPFPLRFDENKKKFSDFPLLESELQAISERALAVLKEMIAPYVEILPLHIKNSDQVFYALNVLQTYSLDTARSDIRLPYGHIDAYAFPDDVLPQAPIFRLPLDVRAIMPPDEAAAMGVTDDISWGFRTCVSEEFRAAVEAANLKGLLFDTEIKYRMGAKTENDAAAQTPPPVVPKVRTTISTVVKTKKRSLKIKDAGLPAAEEMLCEFEKHLPRPLPQDYRNFLKQCNGGFFDDTDGDDYFYFPVQEIPGNSESDSYSSGGISSFYYLDIDMTKESCDAAENELLWVFIFYHKFAPFPDYFLPIGQDWGGNLVCLSLGEKDYGHVYLWDHEYEPQEPDYEHCYFAAASFQEFLDSLEVH